MPVLRKNICSSSERLYNNTLNKRKVYSFLVVHPGRLPDEY